MAIKPEELDRLDDSELDLVNHLEVLIDGYLKINYIPGQETVEISSDKLGDKSSLAQLTPRTRKELYRRYTEVGWSEMSAMSDKVFLSRTISR